jgi:pyrroline-5-carboxylate reductase
MASGVGVVGLIGGGVMGASIVNALLKAGLSANNVRVDETNETTRRELKRRFGPQLQLFDSCQNAFCSGLDVLVLAVKPQYARVALKGVRLQPSGAFSCGKTS